MSGTLPLPFVDVLAEYEQSLAAVRISGQMPWQYNDGGRRAAGYLGSARDCVCRAIAIATELPYERVYDGLNALGAAERFSRTRRHKSSARLGVHIRTTRRYLDALGWRWIPTMAIGTGCRVHLRPDELPDGRLIVSCSRHLTAVIDGVIHDTHDPGRMGRRCVYGYWTRPEVRG